MQRRAGVVILAALVLAAATPSSYYLVVTGDAGERLWTLPLRPRTPVALAYQNSIYRAATEEVFSPSADGFALIAVRSTSEAVLAYNGLPAPYARQGRWYVAPASRSLPGLVLRIGRAGRQHLLVGDRIVPLYQAGEGARLSVTVERAPRVIAALRAWGRR